MARYTNEEDAGSRGQCSCCAAADPDLRASHHLSLARDYRLGEVRMHLVGNGMRSERAEECLRWLAHVIDQYTGIPDPHTGAPLAWWEARHQLMMARESIARKAYADAPEAYRKRVEGQPPNEVPGFTHLMVDVGTPFPEEEPYVPTPEAAQWEDDPDGWEEYEPGWNDGP